MTHITLFEFLLLLELLQTFANSNILSSLYSMSQLIYLMMIEQHILKEKILLSNYFIDLYKYIYISYNLLLV
jgi:hypothetical protein